MKKLLFVFLFFLLFLNLSVFADLPECNSKESTIKFLDASISFLKEHYNVKMINQKNEISTYACAIYKEGTVFAFVTHSGIVRVVEAIQRDDNWIYYVYSKKAFDENATLIKTIGDKRIYLNDDNNIIELGREKNTTVLKVFSNVMTSYLLKMYMGE